MSGDEPLTVGTAGHIDHGKTALVRALTGRDTDRLPEEQARGMSIDLGFAQLDVGGRLLSLVDVPGHERFVRTMVAGATGVDLFLLVVAADDGVMPQTVEHAAVLRALGVRAGVVAVTKTDLADSARAREEVRALVDEGVPIVDCSVHAGTGIEQVRAAIAHVAGRAARCAAARRPGRAPRRSLVHDPRRRHRGHRDAVVGLARRRRPRHPVAVRPARQGAQRPGARRRRRAGDRRAARRGEPRHLAGVRVDAIGRGDVVASEDAGLQPAWILDVALELGDADVPRRAQIHHGTRETPARIADREPGRWQLRCERPLIARAGDRFVVRSISPPGTLGGGVVLDPAARRTRRPEPTASSRRPPRRPRRRSHDPLSETALELERTLREAADRPPRDTRAGRGRRGGAGRAAGRRPRRAA